MEEKGMREEPNSPARNRIQGLVDENSFVELMAPVVSRSTDFNPESKKEATDGVVCGHGLIDGRLVFVYSQDSSVLGGTIGEMHAKKILAIYDMARKMQAPVIGLLDSQGVRISESVDAMESIAALYQASGALSGVVPQIVAVFGKAGGGLSVLAQMADFAYMTEDANLFLNSPNAILENSKDKEDTSASEFQYGEAGNVCGVGDEASVLGQIRTTISLLPDGYMEDGPVTDAADDLNRASSGLSDLRKDAVAFAKEISDNQIFVPYRGGAFLDMTTALISLGGHTVGFVGNNESASTLMTAEGCRKAADFVRFCDAFAIPVLTMVNVTGYERSFENERHMARALAALAAAYADATVPAITLYAKDAVGSAYLSMNPKSLGADLVYAYEDANIRPMDAKLAGEILAEGRGMDASAAEAEFAQKACGVMPAAQRGYVDRLIGFDDTRKYLISGFYMLASKMEFPQDKRHTAK